MNANFALWRRGARCLLMAVGASLALARASAADAPDAAAPAPAPKPPPAAGTWFVFSPPANADEVLASASRVKMLAIAKTFLERDQPELHARLKAADNPFYAKQAAPPEPIVAANATTSAPATPAGPPKMSDEDKLRAVGEKLQPTGILEAGNRRLVAFSGNGGGTIDVGSSFTFSLPPDLTPVSVLLLDANDTSCTLKLNTTTVTISYVLKTSGAARQPASSPPPSQPKP